MAAGRRGQQDQPLHSRRNHHFSCSTSSTKVLSLCGSTDRLQHCLAPRRPGFRFPADSRLEAFTIEHRSYPRFEAHVVSFLADEVTFEVTEASGPGGWMERRTTSWAST